MAPSLSQIGATRLNRRSLIELIEMGGDRIRVGIPLIGLIVLGLARPIAAQPAIASPEPPSSPTPAEPAAPDLNPVESLAEFPTAELPAAEFPTAELPTAELPTAADPVTANPATADPVPVESPVAESPATDPTTANDLNLDPGVIDNSPVLQRWLQEVPDVRSDIRSDPSFRTRLRWGYAQFPATDQAAGYYVGIEDIFVADSPLTVSAEYQAAFATEQRTYGADVRYYLLPLGSGVNLAPVLGYRSIETNDYNTSGANVGIRLLLVPSRTGAADLSFTQTWVSPGSEDEVGISTLTFSYALTDRLRLSTDLQKQNAPQAKDSRIGIGLEWLF